MMRSGANSHRGSARSISIKSVTRRQTSDDSEVYYHEYVMETLKEIAEVGRTIA